MRNSHASLPHSRNGNVATLLTSTHIHTHVIVVWCLFAFSTKEIASLIILHISCRKMSTFTVMCFSVWVFNFYLNFMHHSHKGICLCPSWSSLIPRLHSHMSEKAWMPYLYVSNLQCARVLYAVHTNYGLC